MSFSEVERRFTPCDPAAARSRADELVDWLRDYAPGRIDSRVLDERRCIAPGVLLDLARRGLFGLQVPEEYGGLGLPYAETARVVTQLSAVDTALSVFVDSQRCIGIRPIVAFGSASLRSEVLPLLAAGRMLSGYAQTELSAGADFQALTTRFVRNRAGGWTLDGQKTWIGAGAWAGVLTVIGQTHDAPGDESRGISAFAVRTDRAGVRIGPELLSLGIRLFPQSRILFDSVAVDDRDALGEPGGGLYPAIDSMSASRLAIATKAAGVMKRALQLVGRFAARRQIRGESLIAKGSVLAILGPLVAKTEAISRLVHRANAVLDRGGSLLMEVPLVLKVAASEFAFDTVDTAVQLLGSRGYDEINLVPQMMRDVRVFRIFEGPTEALVDFLGQRMRGPRRRDLCRFLETELGARAIAAQLEEVVSVARIGAVHNAAVGWVAVWALVAASLAGARSPAEEAMAAWARSELERACLEVTQGPSTAAFASLRQELEAIIGDYRQSIGDLALSPPNENTIPDEAIATPHDPRGNK